MTSKHQALRDALSHRIAEVESYQINIDNYTLAIAKINTEYPDDLDLAGPFKAELQQRLDAEIIQQRRAVIIRDVIADQVHQAERTQP